MTPNMDEFPVELKALQEEYRKSLPRKISYIAALQEAIRAGDSTRDIIDDYLHQAHKLAGSAALYGLSALSNAARELERELTKIGTETGSEEHSLSQELGVQVGKLFGKLKETLPNLDRDR